MAFLTKGGTKAPLGPVSLGAWFLRRPDATALPPLSRPFGNAAAASGNILPELYSLALNPALPPFCASAANTALAVENPPPDWRACIAQKDHDHDYYYYF